MQYPTEIKTENLICFAGFKEQKITVNPKIDPVRFYNRTTTIIFGISC